jgi:hypothetical protein
MVNAGMTPAQVLVAATKTAADIMNLLLDDITNTRRISNVYLQGAALDRGAMRASFTAP